MDESKVSTVKSKNDPFSLKFAAPAELHMQDRLRDLLLDIEDRIFQGTLGSIKVNWPAHSHHNDDRVNIKSMLFFPLGDG